ncbi:hypothetical protein CMEL01_01036 [Colletotrichum melonis]|uniref:Uncharacterized protein n=1 Tax=Colletotrichum melonis TaxID=1209925 RepID=A0AAI9V292_9PEZI|nr:hypothetical protein CMEL01_01036 [Colletotrichum melonis]
MRLDIRIHFWVTHDVPHGFDDPLSQQGDQDRANQMASPAYTALQVHHSAGLGSYHEGYPDSKAFPSRTVKVPGLQLMAAFSSASDLRPIPRCSGSAAAVRQGDTNPLILIAPTDEQGSEKAISCSSLREACANRANTQLQVITHSLHPDVFPGLAARCNILYVVAFHTHGHKPTRRIYGAARWDERDVSLRNDGS